MVSLPPHSIASGRAIGCGRTYALVVDDLDDGSESASEGVVVAENNNAADLNEAPVGSLNQSFAHCDLLLIWKVGETVSPKMFWFRGAHKSWMFRKDCLCVRSRRGKAMCSYQKSDMIWVDVVCRCSHLENAW